MKKPTVSEATTEQIQEAFTSRQKEGKCQLCNAVFNKRRPDQLFCTAEHRKLFWSIKKSLGAKK